jgi:hypothetical protein
VLPAALADQRDRFNYVVAEGRRTYADFDVTILAQQVQGPLANLVEASERVAPGSGAGVLAAIFGPVVQLVGQHRLGGGSHDLLLARLPGMAGLVVADPPRVFGSLANAVVHLQRYRAPVDEWLRRVENAAASGGVTTTLQAGQVAAWVLGLSHFRDGALAVASTLSDEAFSAALGATEVSARAEALEKLRRDRWWRPGHTLSDRPRVVHRVGAFRGFGGTFLSPPRLGTRDDHIVIRAGDDAWALHADAWGATLTRTNPDGVEFASPSPAAIPPGVQPYSAAVVSDITALAIPTSYKVLVVEPGA